MFLISFVPAKQFIHFKSTGHKKLQKQLITYFEQMLVLKDVLDLVQNLVLQGGKSSNQTSTLQTITRVIQVMNLVYQVQFNKNATFAILLDDTVPQS